jgi:hypothetical protein
MLFGNVWQHEAGDARKLGEGHPANVFGTSFAFALLAVLVYAWLMPAPADAVQALVQGVVVGAGIVAASFGINYQVANRSATLLRSTVVTTRCSSPSTA